MKSSGDSGLKATQVEAGALALGCDSSANTGAVWSADNESDEEADEGDSAAAEDIRVEASRSVLEGRKYVFCPHRHLQIYLG